MIEIDNKEYNENKIKWQIKVDVDGKTQFLVASMSNRFMEDLSEEKLIKCIEDTIKFDVERLIREYKKKYIK